MLQPKGNRASASCGGRGLFAGIWPSPIPTFTHLTSPKASASQSLLATCRTRRQASKPSASTSAAQMPRRAPTFGDAGQEDGKAVQALGRAWQQRARYLRFVRQGLMGEAGAAGIDGGRRRELLAYDHARVDIDADAEHPTQVPALTCRRRSPLHRKVEGVGSGRAGQARRGGSGGVSTVESVCSPDRL